MAIITQGNFYTRQRKLNTILFTPGLTISARVAQKRFFRLGSTDCLEVDKDLERLRFIHKQLEEHGCTMPWMLHFTRFHCYKTEKKICFAALIGARTCPWLSATQTLARGQALST